VDQSLFDENLRKELDRFPPPDLIDADVETERRVYGEHFRAVRDRVGGPGRRDVEVEDLTVPSFDEHPLALRVYKPLTRGGGGGLVYFHGGAFMMGDLDIEEEKCVVLTRDAGCVIFSVDYRLAPEHPFPTPLEDCYAALCWVAGNAERLGIDRRALGVGGCSAGGALAASVAQLCRDRGGPQLALQMLLYPVLDVSLSEPSVRTLLDDRELRDVARMWERYLGAPLSSPPAGASPAACAKLSGLAPAHITAGELDFLRDEAITYARRLLEAGVSVDLHLWPRTPHAVDLFAPDARVSIQSVRRQAEALRRLLG
jgi:acetyl esterase